MRPELRIKHVILQWLERGRSHDTVGVSIFILKAAAVTSTVVTSIFSLLAAIDAESTRCAGSNWVMGYRSEISDFLALPLMSLIAVIVLMFVLSTEKTRRVIALYDRETFRFRSIRVTFGMIVVYLALIAFLIWFGGMTWFSVVRYNAVLAHCGSATVVN
jgi:hypothetical protein